MAKETESIIDEMENILDSELGEWLTFDRDLERSKGQVIIRWKVSLVPIVLKTEISQKALSDKRLSMGELRRNLKSFMPRVVLRQLISDCNSLLRNANRRKIHQVEKDVDNWTHSTAVMLENILGKSAIPDFVKKIEIPSKIKPKSLQALQFIVESRVDYLKKIL
ncbi:MAG: hypothetical protein JWQ35_477 [Bacteriovoracaceae bacterium]|nr:hypothetical protein [Bacteriovoracaceae bacterium]